MSPIAHEMSRSFFAADLSQYGFVSGQWLIEAGTADSESLHRVIGPGSGVAGAAEVDTAKTATQLQAAG